MKRLILVAAIVLSWAATALPAAPIPLRSLQAIHALSNEEAQKALPVAFEATVTYFRNYEKTMFVQDGEAAIYIQATTDTLFIAGDRVLIKGTTHESFRPYVLSSDITLVHHGQLPTAIPAVFDDLIHSRYDCRLVTVHALVRTADVLSASARDASVQMRAEGGNINLVVDSNDAGALRGMLDAEVEVTGAVSGTFDGKMQQTGVLMHVGSLAGIKVLKRAATDPWSLPITPMDEILTTYHVNNLSQRVRVHGTVTYYQPGAAIVLQNGTRSLWIRTLAREDLRVGDVIDATGIPDVHDGFLTLTLSEFKNSHQWAPLIPRPSKWSELTQSHNIFDLVAIEGRVVMKVREAAQDEYVLSSDGQLISAIIRHPTATFSAVGPPSLPPMKEIPLGSRVQVTGICILEDSHAFDAQVPFDILMRSFDDIKVTAQPSLLNVRNLVLLVGVLFVVILAVGAKGWALERKVRRQTAALAARVEAEAALERTMAQVEQRRSHILEDINGARPLAEILEQIVDLVSFRLGGIPCWCEVAGGARLGNYPPGLESFRIVREPIPARAGTPLGYIFAGFDSRTGPSATESEALPVCARLATVAIETRRLYTDLLHRSEFDLLTDVHNRFSFDKQIEIRVEQARSTAGVFGLIYIDLDEFKQVNDLYGHHVGDLYLQEVALRMKRQLRSQDQLARLGGDEFAALIAAVPNRAGVHEIAQRLERCLDDPFKMGGYLLRGSASVGVALYPEDGVTRDSLLTAADAAMYAAKHGRRHLLELASSPDEASLVPRDHD